MWIEGMQQPYTTLFSEQASRISRRNWVGHDCGPILQHHSGTTRAVRSNDLGKRKAGEQQGGRQLNAVSSE